MRRVEVDDHWRHLVNPRSAPFQMKVLNLGSGSGPGVAKLDFHGPLTVLCGRNGAGKSTIVSAIGSLFGVARQPIVLQDGPEGVGPSGLVHWRGKDVEVGGDPTFDGNGRLEVSLVDPAQTGQLQRYFRELGGNGLSDLVDSAEPAQHPREALQELSYILSRSYSTVTVAELEVEVAGREVVPYFRVSSDVGDYGSESMGLGEFSVFFLHWVLRRLDKKRGSLVLIEEPESFISPVAQRRLMNVVARYCDERSACIVITTHSPAVLSCVPLRFIRAVRREVGVVNVEQTTTADYLEELDMLPGPWGVVLVEDIAAKEMLMWIGSQNISDRFRSEYEFVVCPQGYSQIFEIMKRIPLLSEVRLIGVVDGDKRAEAHNLGVRGPLFALPGGAPPDLLIRQAVEASTDEFAALLGVDALRLKRWVTSLVGQDHHDWAPELARFTGRSAAEVLSAGARMWCRAAENQSEISDFCNAWSKVSGDTAD